MNKNNVDSLSVNFVNVNTNKIRFVNRNIFKVLFIKLYASIVLVEIMRWPHTSKIYYSINMIYNSLCIPMHHKYKIYGVFEAWPTENYRIYIWFIDRHLKLRAYLFPSKYQTYIY